MSEVPPGQELQANRPLSKTAEWILWCSFLATVAVATAYFQAFDAMKPFDDEGGFITLLRRFLQGGAPYRDLATFYGPSYFLYEWIAHSLFPLGPPSNDSVRFVSIAFWALSSVFAFVLVRNTTRSWLLG